MEDFTREVRAPVDLVIETVREESKEWRESVIPPDLRRLGVARMKGSFQPPFFRFWLWKPSCGEEVPMTLRAVVIPTPGGGARVRGEVGRGRPSAPSLVFTLLAFALGSGVGGVLAGIVAAMFALVSGLAPLHLRSTRDSDREPEADYLLRRLGHALEVAEERAALGPASPPAALPPSRAASRKSSARTPWKRV